MAWPVVGEGRERRVLANLRGVWVLVPVSNTKDARVSKMAVLVEGSSEIFFENIVCVFYFSINFEKIPFP